ncbi:MAG TPA: tetratricopeptide repeat protein [Bryobacteraceae bacterium]|jgi:tetratricopeptide (TPR) repeat protein|nr:tetratricopeptide repeat protein [Bryobacteraceae bacterium]
MHRALSTALLSAALISSAELEKARDAQDRAALDRALKELAAAAEKQPNDAATQYRLAQAGSYAAEVAIEQRDKNAARGAAETGIRAAEKAVSLKPDSADYHRLLGTLCGQAVRDVISGMKYGKCALDEVNKAIQLDPKGARNYLSRGVGYYYLPPAFGGGLDKAIADFQKAIELDPKLAEAHLWLGVALRKANRNAEARKALERSLQLNPNRVWAKQQLDKTPAS